MDQGQLEPIITACPNAKFQMTLTETRHSNSLKLVGSRLEKVVLFEYGMNDFHSLTKGWNACPNIVKVALVGNASLRYFRAMFIEPKLGLLKLEILTGIGEEMSEVKNVLNCVAKGTEELRHLYITISEL